MNFTKLSKLTKFELGPKNCSGVFLGRAPPDDAEEDVEFRAASTPLMSNGDDAPFRPAVDGDVVWPRDVSKSKSSASAAMATPDGDQGS